MRKNLGFTLVELLIVIAILGALATVVVVAINPVDKLAKSKDTGRISSVTQLGHAVEAYYTSNNSVYPDVSDWANILVDSGHPSAFPPGIEYLAPYGVTACSTNVEPATYPSYCYDADTTGDGGAIVFTKLEAQGKRSLCTAPEEVYFVYSTVDGRAGNICSENDPAPWSPDTQTYVE